MALPGKGQTRALTPEYECAVIDGDAESGLPDKRLAVTMEVATFAHLGARTAVAVDSFALEPVTWFTIDASSGVAVGSPGTYRDALAALRAAPRGTEKIAPTYAARGS